VQPARERGAICAVTGCGGCTRPYKEPSGEPAAPARERPHAADAAGGGGPISEFFAALGADWRLTEAQRVKLAPGVKAALDMGWTPRTLASATGTNTTGVRNPYAVLAVRLSRTELPAPSARSTRPPWCGECDQVTRMLDYHGDAPRPCPRCKANVGSPG
jgi:hypothetical protein